MFISEDFLEEICLKVYNRSNLASHDDFGGIFIYCNKCDTEWHLLLIKQWSVLSMNC